MKHASIIPLIGGEAIGSERAFGSRPEYLLSYEAFAANDSHLVNWYGGEVPYLLVDKGAKAPYKVDVMSTVCPCAGLSQMSHGFGDHNPNNQWMPKTTEYVLSDLQPTVLWGENAPGFAGKIGKNVRTELKAIGKKHGYTMSVYRTRSLLHGVPQVRERAFYFFWKGDKTPVFNFFNEPWKPIEDTIRDERANFQAEVINKKIPSEDPYYRYVLEVIRGGISHREHCATVEATATRGADMLTYIETHGHDYRKHVAPWMKANGFEREVEKCYRRQDKLDAGGSVMRRGVIVPKDRIGAFVGHYPTSLTHPDQDRFITYREAMTIMGLPSDFELLNPKKSFNHICQNVPVKTAQDMASEVKASLEGKRDWIKTDYLFQQNHQQKTVEGWTD